MLGTITLTVGQPDGVSVAQKEDASETMDAVTDEQAPQVNGEKVEKESPDVNDITPVEEKAVEEKPNETSEVGFKKIFRFVGFKFTLKKDKSEEKDPVKLLTVRDKDGDEVNGIDEPAKEEAAEAQEKDGNVEVPTAEAEVTKDTDNTETPNGPVEAAETTDEAVKEDGAEKEGEASPPAQEAALSPFRKLFSTGLFSNLRKKSSIKKTKEEEDKEAAGEEEAAKTEETTAEDKGEKEEAEQETNKEAPTTPEGETPKEEALATAEEAKPELEVSAESPSASSDEAKPDEEKAEEEEKAPAEVTSDSELQTSQEKVKPQGSPLKKLFTGAGLKKLSTKKQKSKKDAEAKLTESGEQVTEQIQSSIESTDAAKADSGPSSPEDSGEHAIEAEAAQAESTQGPESEVASDGEKKKEGIIAWSSFKKLVTPKKRVKRPSESDDEVTSEKAAKSATLSSSESAPLSDKSVDEEAKEDKPSEEEAKTENAEKLGSSTEEPKKKMDTSVSWEALMCMGGPKKRTRKTSDSDDEETNIAEESAAPAAGEDEKQDKTETAVENPENAEGEIEAASSPEPLSSPPERESAWDTLKRMVMPKSKAKVEEKTEECTEQVQSESEAPKDESSFSLRKLFPGLRKKKVEKQASTEGEDDTPSVVPLSEFDAQPEDMQEQPTEVARTTCQASSEERAPSWIPASVEHGDQRDQLSDITEEAATPKSVDTDIAEDETEDQTTLPSKAAGGRLCTAEVAQASPSETTCDPEVHMSENAQEDIAGFEAEISEIAPETTVISEDVPVETALEKTEIEPTVEHVDSKMKTLLEPHAHDEAVAICTGLGTNEIAEVALEKPAMPIIECLSAVSNAHGTEVSPEEPSLKTEEAVVTEDALLSAQVQQVKNTEVEHVESSESKIHGTETARESCEPEPLYVSAVTSAVKTTIVADGAIINTVAPTVEIPVCSQNGEVTKLSVETDKETTDMQQQIASEVVAASEEVCVIRESVVLVSSSSADQVNTGPLTEDTSKIEAQSMVIAQTVIQDAMDKVAEQATTPEASTPTPGQAVAAMEKEIEIQTLVITDTPATISCEKPAQKPIFVATECETTPIEVAEILDTSEGKKPEEGLKKAGEVSEKTIIEEVVEIIGNAQTDDKVDVVKEEPEDDKPQPEEKEIYLPVQVVLQTAQEVEEESIKEEAVEEFETNGLMDAQEHGAAAEMTADEEAERTTSGKCAEVMAQVIEVIEEAVKEIEPVSTEVTPAS
ncbi:A-kinase anchor protein 12b isoform X2 [Dunckerocampus dactyliophorus]|uniref:A-kinase anchor protein 12b isoform X2 n=1 Tax=Dunckerocampus dactyliophorus TaxID=161453 RepID=UPI0024070F5B|nr:A-kinase anchor protein 12b isoform X2 [Dunckerocampus dactyliophorus]